MKNLIRAMWRKCFLTSRTKRQKSKRLMRKFVELGWTRSSEIYWKSFKLIWSGHSHESRKFSIGFWFLLGKAERGKVYKNSAINCHPRGNSENLTPSTSRLVNWFHRSQSVFLLGMVFRSPPCSTKNYRESVMFHQEFPVLWTAP